MLFFSTFFITVLLSSVTFALPIPALVQENVPVLEKRGFELPIQRVSKSLQRRGDLTGKAGLGDVADLAYTVSVQIGSSETSLLLDTGSSDLWVMSDACKSEVCATSTSPRYTSASGRPTGADVDLRFGDSSTGTHASGPIVFDTVAVAGLSMDNQPFAAIDDTNNSAVAGGNSGLFGLGFPSQSYVQAAVINKQFDRPLTTDAFTMATASEGPLVSRLAMSGQLEKPMFTITLQRDTIDVGGTEGALTIGKLPDGIDETAITWVPVRLYDPAVGGQNPPSFAPQEIYPLRWEIPLDGVYLDGKRLPDTNSTGSGIGSNRLSALIDSGNSLLRGPTDVVHTVLSQVSPQYAADTTSEPIYPCTVPHTIFFEFGGKMFPVDPRDFMSPASAGDGTNCSVENLVSTDPPTLGALFSWSLGDPFFKSNLVVFYYGNLTHPSVDPPRIGLLNTVPPDANERLQKAVQVAEENNGVYPSTSHIAPPPPTPTHVPGASVSTPNPVLTALQRFSHGGMPVNTASSSPPNLSAPISMATVPLLLYLLLCL